jgi:hypothetical protein
MFLCLSWIFFVHSLISYVLFTHCLTYGNEQLFHWTRITHRTDTTFKKSSITWQLTFTTGKATRPRPTHQNAKYLKISFPRTFNTSYQASKVRRADNLTTFMCRLSRNLGSSTSWNPKGLSRPVMGLLYLCFTRPVKTTAPFIKTSHISNAFLKPQRRLHTTSSKQSMN